MICPYLKAKFLNVHCVAHLCYTYMIRLLTILPIKDIIPMLSITETRAENSKISKKLYKVMMNLL